MDRIYLDSDRKVELKVLYPLLFYGERGLVNGLVLKLHGNVEITKKFLKMIRFCSSQSPDWVDMVKEVSFLIEPSFSEFGDPDLVVVCDCDSAQGYARHVVFVEAKVVKYKESAVTIKKSGDIVKGINSRINAQLTLRYRLSRVLKRRKLREEPVEETQQEWENSYASYPTEAWTHGHTGTGHRDTRGRFSCASAGNVV